MTKMRTDDRLPAERLWAAVQSGERELQSIIKGASWEPVAVRERQVQMRLLSYLIEGLSPLMLHSSIAMKMHTAGLGRKEIPTPEQEAEAGVLRDSDGNILVPQEAILLAMRDAAKLFRIGKERASQVLASSVFVPAQLLYVPVRRDGRPLKTYDRVDVRRVVVQRQGVLRGRAVIDPPWQVMGVLEFDPQLISLEVLADILDLAGTKAGLGDYRPQKGGAFGRYRLTTLQVAGPAT
jgi:hypothetical protein